MNIFKAHKISQRIEKASKKVTTGTAISVFSNVVNIITDEGICAIQELSVPFTPFSVLLKNSFPFNNLHIRPNERVYFNEKEIIAEKFIIALDNAEIVDTSLSQATNYPALESILRLLTDKLSSLLVNSAAVNISNKGLMDLAIHINIVNGFIYVNNELKETNTLNYLKNKFNGKELFTEKFSDEMSSLIGLGDGLTPSFDDFLVGLLSFLRFIGAISNKTQHYHNILCNSIKMNLKKTTPLSESFLDSAISNDFSEPLLRLYNHVNKSDVSSIDEALDRIAKIGHSSGIDSLNGILFGIKLYIASESI